MAISFGAPTRSLEPLLIDVLDAAEVLGIGRTKAWQLVRSGELETIRVDRRRLVVVDSLRSWVERQRSEQVPV